MFPMIGLKTQALQDVGVCCIRLRVFTRLLGRVEEPSTPPSLTFNMVQSSPAVELSNLQGTWLIMCKFKESIRFKRVLLG